MKYDGKTVGKERKNMDNKILVETSARHIHLTKEQIEILFGEGHELTVKKELSQPGQFACVEKCDILGAEKNGVRKSIKGVSILGPARNAAQVEVSLTDARTLGLNAPVRESGDIKGSAPCTLVGPCGTVELSEGVIAAKRHIHLTPEAAKELGVCDKEIVSVKLSTARPLVFGDVVVRVSEKFAPAMHIDTDESNAACAVGEVYGEIVK